MLKQDFKAAARILFLSGKKPFFFSLASSFAYYIFVILALRYATPAICTLILGISPITIALYGNWLQKECDFKKLLLPSFLILMGLGIINAPHFSTPTLSFSSYILGLLCSFIALGNWSWYVVANARFLKNHPEVSSQDWSTLQGVNALTWVAIFGAFFWLFSGKDLDAMHYSTDNPAFIPFILGSAILGILCSWVGAFLWNQASFRLPVSLAGQLTIFETIFGLCFVCLYNRCLPPFWECIGIFFLLIAIIYGIRVSARVSTGKVS